MELGNIETCGMYYISSSDGAWEYGNNALVSRRITGRRSSLHKDTSLGIVAPINQWTEVLNRETYCNTDSNGAIVPI